MKKRQWFVFQVFTGGRDLLGQPTWHWEITLKYHTKAEVFKEYNRPGYARRVREVWTLKQMVEKLQPETVKQILESNRGRILADKERYSEE